MLTYPNAVKPGDTIGLVLPSSMITQDTLDRVIKAAHSLGLKCKIGPTMARTVELFTAQQDGYIDQLLPKLSPDMRDEYQHFIASGYMAGNPQDRAADINSFYADPEVQAIWCLWGGYGAAKVLPHLDYDLIRQNPKQILGYSDITNIISAIYVKSQLCTYHAPMLAPNFTKPELLDNGQVDGYTLSYFGQFIMSNWSEVQISNPTDLPMQTMVDGTADGIIYGGNLAVLTRLIGTPYLCDTTGKIIFLEEVRTHVVLCDMYLTQLEQAGFFDNIAGLILGDFLNCHNRTGYDKCQDWLIDQVLYNHFHDAPFPVLANVKIGHDQHTATVPLGAMCHLDADQHEIIISRML